MNNNNNYRQTLLAAAIACLNAPAFALDDLPDDSLGEITGQDGIQLVASATSVNMGSAFWREDGRELQLRTLALTPVSATDPTLATISVDIGASNPTASGVPAIGINVDLAPIQLTVGEVCVTASLAANCGGRSMGEMAFITNKNSTFSFFNTNGFFDSSSSNARVRINVDDAELYLAQTFDKDGAGALYSPIRNLAIFNNLIINSRFDGKLSIDSTEGIRAQGTLSLTRSGAGNINNGIQFDLYHNENVASGFTTTGAKGIIRLGLSGTINNFDMKMRGDNSLNITDALNAPVNTSGIKLNLSGILSNGNFVLEVSEADNDARTLGADGVRFSQWVDFSNGASLTPSSPDITTGDVYLNLLTSGQRLPALTSTVSGFTFNPLPAAADALGIAVRGLNFQAYPKVVSFYDVDTNVLHPQNWSLITTYHNLNSNLTLMGGGHPSATTPRGIGFDMQLAATGRNASGTEGTHILIADPSVGTYLGWRNINLVSEVRGGQLVLADSVNDGVNGIRFTAESLKLSANGQFAVGQLPNGGSVTSLPNTGHAFGLAIDIESGAGTQLTFSPPTSGNYMGFSGSLNFGDTGFDTDSINSNSITLSEPSSSGGNSPRFQYGDITGRIDIVNGKIDTVSSPTADSVSFEYTLDISPDVGIYTAKDVQLITGGASPTTYRWGQLVIPSGQLYSKLTIKPQ